MVLSKDLKIAICFGLIIGVLLSVCDLCYASENVEISVSTGVGVDTNNGVFISSSGSTGYFEIEPGYHYVVNNSSGYRRGLFFSNTVPTIGEPAQFIQYLENNNSYEFNSSSVGYLYFDIYAYGSGGFTVTREPLEGMSNFIDNIAYSLSFADLSSVFVLVVPILAISVLVGLGVYFIRRIINKTKKAKGGI